MRTIKILAAAAALSLGAAACAPSATPVSGQNSSPAPAPTATTNDVTQPAAAAAAAPGPECHNQDVRVTGSPGNGALGHSAQLLRFTNISGHTCFVQGYPGAALLGTSGHVLLNAQRTLDGYFGSALIAAKDPGLTAPPRVILRPGQSGVAELEWEDNNPIGGVPGGCRVRASSALVVTSPDSTQPATLPGLRLVCDAFEIGPLLDEAAN